MNKKSSFFLTVIIITVLVGFVSGIVGELWINHFLYGDLNVSLKSYSDLSARLDKLSESKEQTLKEFFSNRDLSISKVVEDVQPALATVYYTAYKTKAKTLKNVFYESDINSQATILTSDGWLLTSFFGVPKEHLTVVHDNKQYKVEKVLTDEFHKVNFIKISAQDLPVVNFGSEKYLTLGQTVLITEADSEVFVKNIEKLNFTEDSNYNLIHNVDRFYQYIKVAGVNDELNHSGAAVFNLKGDVIGWLINEEKGIVVPVNYFSSVLEMIVKDQKIDRPTLNFQFIDLSQALNYNLDNNKGAYVYASQEKDLRKGDIILKVENEEVTASNTLSKIIQDYQINQEVKFLINRGEQELEVSLVLK